MTSLGFDLGDVSFIEVNFTTDDVFERLIEAGYDPELKTVFLWEGVTLYLNEEAVSETMRQVRTRSAEGSVLVADFYGERMLEFGKKAARQKALNATGERLVFGLDFKQDHVSAMANFADERGFELKAHHFMGSQHKDGPFMAVVELLNRGLTTSQLKLAIKHIQNPFVSARNIERTQEPRVYNTSIKRCSSNARRSPRLQQIKYLTYQSLSMALITTDDLFFHGKYPNSVLEQIPLNLFAQSK